MQRILIAITTSALMASAASAAFHVEVDVDQAGIYPLGSLVQIDLSLTTDGVMPERGMSLGLWGALAVLSWLGASRARTPRRTRRSGPRSRMGR